MQSTVRAFFLKLRRVCPPLCFALCAASTSLAVAQASHSNPSPTRAVASPGPSANGSPKPNSKSGIKLPPTAKSPPPKNAPPVPKHSLESPKPAKADTVAVEAPQNPATRIVELPQVIPYLVFLIPVLFIGIVLAARAGSKSSSSSLTRDERDQFEARLLVFGLVTLAGAGLLWISMVPLAPSKWVSVEIASIGILLASGFFGFLFGLPHVNAGLSNAPNSTQPLLKTSTNLEQIADKLTQLLSGIALAELLSVPAHIKEFDDYISANHEAPVLLGSAMLLYFAPLGFVLAYVFTRTVGSSVFAKYDAVLWESGREITINFPPLPDVEGDPSNDQKAVAQRIVAIPLGDLQDDIQRMTWGRAQALLTNYADARTAFSLVYPRSTTDPRFLYDYSTTLYNDPTFDDPQFVLLMAKKAEEVACAAASPDNVLIGQICSLKIATYLYGASGGYVEAIKSVNSLLLSKYQPTKVLRFYRACAFGQLYKLESTSPRTVTTDETDAVVSLVNRDVAITIAMGPRYLKQVILVADPAEHAKSPEENDLQSIAAVSKPLWAQLGRDLPLPPPPPKCDAPPLPLPPATAPDSAIVSFVKSCPP